MDSTMNIHISISMRSTTAMPRNSPLVSSSIWEAVRHSSALISRLVQRFITSAMTKAGINENRDRNHITWRPNSHLPSMTIHRYKGGLSA